LTHRSLVERAAELYSNRPLIIPIPETPVRLAAWLMEKLLPAPPITLPMLEILQHDDRIDEQESCEVFGLALTPLDETLQRYIGPEDFAVPE
jgi:hypothetical protein